MENENVRLEIKYRGQPRCYPNAFGTVSATHRTDAPRRDCIILREARASCTAYTAFQETNRVGFVESHGKILRREAEGASFWGCGAMSDPLKAFLILTSFTKEVG